MTSPSPALASVAAASIVFTLWSLCAPDLRGQTDAVPLDSFALPEAVVIGGRSAVAPQSIGHTFDVVTRAELASLPVSSTAEALALVSGLDLRQRGPRGVQADLSIRGGTFDQVLVLVNGIKLADPQTGHHVLNIPVPLANIERIEVLKGPGARVYGQNAFAGAVNIITRPGSQEGLTARAEAGENGLAGFGVSLDLPLRGVEHTLSYQRDVSSGYRYNTDFDVANVFYQSRLSLGEGTLGVIAGLTERAFGANGFYASAAATEQYEEVQTSIAAVTYEHTAARTRLTHRASWRRNQDEYVFIRRNPSVYRNLHLSHTYGYDGYASTANALGELGVGLEVQGVSLESSILGDRARAVVNGLVEQEFAWAGGALRVTPGVTVNYLSDVGARVLPGLDLHYRATQRLSLFANAGLTYRVPTYTDLYYADRYTEGNADLVPERAYAYEVGARYEVGALNLRASAWQREAVDLIDYVRDGQADTVWQARNVTDATFRGVEVQAETRRLTAWLPLARVSYNYIDAELPGRDGAADGDLVSRYALDNLVHQLTATAVARIAAPLTASLTFRYADRLTAPATPGSPPLDYALLDARVNYRWGPATLFAEASNLTGERYAQANGVELPGRWVRVGGEVRLRR